MKAVRIADGRGPQRIYASKMVKTTVIRPSPTPSVRTVVAVNARLFASAACISKIADELFDPSQCGGVCCGGIPGVYVSRAAMVHHRRAGEQKANTVNGCRDCLRAGGARQRSTLAAAVCRSSRPLKVDPSTTVPKIATVAERSKRSGPTGICTRCRDRAAWSARCPGRPRFTNNGPPSGLKQAPANSILAKVPRRGKHVS